MRKTGIVKRGGAPLGIYDRDYMKEPPSGGAPRPPWGTVFVVLMLAALLALALLRSR